ncbi:MAG: hypothetical protein IPM63_11635 [Acidobacteriota bacterium]|nr:MAG: hypothetical protein IPM63_11635 [Acidobacteriota bacterium]
MKTMLGFSLTRPGEPEKPLENLHFLEHDLYKILFHTVADRNLRNHEQSRYSVFEVSKITRNQVSLRQLLSLDRTITLEPGQLVSIDLGALGELVVTLLKTRRS